MSKKFILTILILMLSGNSFAVESNDMQNKMLSNYQEMDKIMKRAEVADNRNEKHQLMMQHLEKMEENMKIMKGMHLAEKNTGQEDINMQQMHMQEEIHMIHQKNMMMEIMIEKMLEQHKLMIKGN